MSANTDLLEKGYGDFAKGDVQAASESWPDDFVWEGPNSEGLPGNGTREGKQAALQALGEAVSAWDEFKLTVDEIIDGGDTVVALGHTEASKGGNSIKGPFVHIWRFRDGAPQRLQFLTDTLLAARTLGVA